MGFKITLDGHIEINADIQLQEVYEVGFNEKFKGVITTLGEQSIEVSGKDFDVIKKFWCESSGCDIVPVFIEVQGTTYSYSWFISDTEIREFNQSAVIKLTDNNYGSKLKSRLEIEQILPFDISEVFTMPGLNRQYVSPLIDRPAPNTRTFQGYRFGNVLEYLLGQYKVEYDTLPDVFYKYLLTTRGGVAFVSVLDNRENGDFNPLVSITLEQVFEAMYKLFGYGFILTSNEIRFVLLEDLGNEKEFLFAKDCEFVTSYVCEDVNYSSVKVGGKTSFGEFTKYKDTGVSETDKNTVMGMVHNAGNFLPSQWKTNNECATGDELDLSLEWLIYDSNVIEFDAEMNIEERGFQGSEDLVIIELISEVSNTVRLVTVQVPTRPFSLNFIKVPIMERKVFNRGLFQSEILKRLICDIGSGNLLFDKNDGEIETKGVQDGEVYGFVYDYGSVSALSAPIMLNPIKSKGLFRDPLPNLKNAHIYQPSSSFVGTLNIDIRISCNSDLPPDDTTIEFRMAELDGVEPNFMTPNRTILGTLTFNQFELNFSTCKTFTATLNNYYFDKTKSYAILLNMTVSGFTVEYMICSDLSSITIVGNSDNDFPKEIETDCEPYKLCHTVETYINPCNKIEGYGFIGINGQGHQPKRIERELTTGKTTIYTKTKKC
jgi:hypothetical protein